MIDAGNDPTGFSVTTIDGRPALLVGNAYGDILTLLYDPTLNNGQGGFAPDRTNLQNAPLAVGTTSTGQQYAVVADQELDQVWLYYRIPGTNQFAAPSRSNGSHPRCWPRGPSRSSPSRATRTRTWRWPTA